ncbi:MAG TPA: fatty acid desaturase [Candidatus Elarobacter sp.]
MIAGETREILRPYRERNTVLALRILAIDLVAYAACFAAIVVVPSPLAKAVLGAVLGLVIGRLFVIGHDACHGSFTPNRRLNALIARVAFLPSLTPFGPWRLGHNQTHHAYTNRRGLDYVWAPLATRDWSRVPPYRRLLERLYRSALGQGANYLLEIWSAYLLVPRASTRRRWRSAYTADTLLVFAVAALTGTLVVALASRTNQSAPLLLLATMTWPFLVWNALMGFVIYQHHTDPAIHWYGAGEPVPETLQSDATQDVIFPGPVNVLFHNIMEHTAHHADPSIPLYHLPAAQRRLISHDAAAVRTKRWTLPGFIETTRRCKLYDFEAGCWTDFQGRPTSSPRA